jgi:uncharacterized protein (DUF1778 family)
MPVKRDAFVKVMLSDKERALLEAASEAAGSTMSSYVRTILVRDARQTLAQEGASHVPARELAAVR